MAWTPPSEWARTLPDAPILDRTISGVVPAAVRHWRGTDPTIDQFALNQHFISIHLGGAKNVSRRGEGHAQTRDVVSGAYSIVPAGAAFHWHTVGPIDFAHIYFDPRTVHHVIERAFDRDPLRVSLQDHLGGHDPLVEALSAALLAELAHPDPLQGYLDDLLHVTLCRALILHSDARRGGPVARHAMAPYRLRRALDFIEANLAEPIGVEEIAAASGMSRFHFSRAFHAAMGKAPYQFLLDRRIAAAKAMLINSDQALSEIAARCGFTSASQFSRMFRRDVGLTPSSFRDRQ